MQGEVEQLINIKKNVEVAMERKDSAEKQLGVLRQTQQEKFGEEKRRVVLLGEVQVTDEQVKLKKEELKALQDQVVFEQANLHELVTKSGLSEQRKQDLMAKDESLDALVLQSKEELRVAEIGVNGMEDRVSRKTLFL